MASIKINKDENMLRVYSINHFSLINEDWQKKLNVEQKTKIKSKSK